MTRAPAKSLSNRKAPAKAAPAKTVKPAPTTKRLPHWLNKKQMAASCGISVQAFDKWGVTQAAAIGNEVFYTVDDVIDNRLALVERRQKEAAAAAASSAPTTEELDAEREKLLLIREQRIGQELKNAATRRETAPVALIDWTLSKIGGQIAAILESVPLKVKRLLPRLTATEVEHIRREIVKAQNLAARVTVDLDEYYDRNPDGDREGDPARAPGA